MRPPEPLIRAVRDPPRDCEDLASIGGVLRQRPEDFEVEELPAYAADGRPGHLLVWLRKRSFTTQDAVREVGRQLGVAQVEIGVAGLKDRDAVTRQQISVPDRVAASLARFEHGAIELSDPRPHSHKLRRGHLHGNRFCIVVRQLPAELDLARAEAHAHAMLERLATQGLRNYYGAQRFGKDLRNLEPGLAALAGRRRRQQKGDLIVSAGQSALFNLYLATRAERGLCRTVLAGDILQKRETGGMFESTDPAADQARLDAGELVVTGPMFGSKMRAPTPGTPAHELEQAVLASVGLSPAKLTKLGRSAPGTRRQLLVWPAQVEVARAPATGSDPGPSLGPGLALRFSLPAGSYATVLLRELCG
ncbi:tRNA pseudouridine(13) synthase TruD [Enhygromyxa salina]|uniref:tRNA pseudouridine synthase D n=1 Tax=Enhygromyxa salina TaxID=215803 RepID=A0A2S9XTL5_9BACT|nr:tRNA pseudouridine(13) synthase TruD [Enhygromyxa salina]PRP96209.1 tRNA pseudouridine synthase D [Enhygromyxa salina]